MTTRELLNGFTREEGIALYNSKKTDKEIYDLCVAKGLTDSYETFVSESQKIFAEKVSQMSKEELLAQIEGAELTDEQLAQIAGGTKSVEEDNKVYMGLGIAGGVAAAGLAVSGYFVITGTALVSAAAAF